MRNATEKRATLTPCAQCPAGNATCTATCCSVLTTNATYHCTCPIDRLGKDCESPRPYTCTLHPLHPHMNCTSLAHAPMPRTSSDAQAACASTHLSLASPPTSLSMSYRLNCTFTVRPNINLTTYPSSTSGPSTAQGRSSRGHVGATSLRGPSPWIPSLSLRTAWCTGITVTGSISDTRWLDREQLLGTTPVDVPVNVTRMVQETAVVRMNGRQVRKRAYVAGGRAYVEAGTVLLQVSLHGHCSNCLVRRYWIEHVGTCWPATGCTRVSGFCGCTRGDV
ncbi:hypothetical protein BCR44DRAFT_1206610 [Catenaria anguillulae PL171]|uniref:EGF-like domain-containing protein n=1 Tax=Catenaria anguillulae PL171 TaxID=765915 RepID=A0A1Y2HFG5_9FUNG|nr:hypothetical protein BCR44DRAFT_1206610 [Catenaria anguillulae PL171]